MPIVDADLSQLEWRVGAFLSQDPIMISEIVTGVDIHTDNAINFFGDKKYRQEAKVFSFRYLYGGSAYAFYADNNMPRFSLSKYEGMLSELKQKYSVLDAWQQEVMATVRRDGEWINPTGRILSFSKKRGRDGWDYSFPQVVNAPVQSLATADIMPLAMVYINKELHRYPDIKLINQVHDSIIIDTPMHNVNLVCTICMKVFNSLPELIEKYFKFQFNVPLTGECQHGSAWGKLTKWK